MKPPISSLLSMTAILATGGTALAVNATVLEPHSESAPQSTEAPAPETSMASPAAVAANEFQIPGIGIVSLSPVDGILSLNTVDVNDGISYTVTETAPGEFEIRFTTPDQVVVFTARLVDGQIVTSATGTSSDVPVAQPPATQPAAPAPPGGGGGAAPGSGQSDYDGGIDYDDDYDDDHDDDGFDFDHDDDHDGGDDD